MRILILSVLIICMYLLRVNKSHILILSQPAGHADPLGVGELLDDEPMKAEDAELVRQARVYVSVVCVPVKRGFA